MLRGSQCPNGVKQETYEKPMEAKEFDRKDLSDPTVRYQLINAESANFGKKQRSRGKDMKLIGIKIN